MTTGYSSAVDHGLQVTLKKENGTQIAPSFYYPVLLNDGLGTGASAYRTRIQQCTGATPRGAGRQEVSTGGCQNDGVPDSCLGFYPNRSPRLKFAAVFDADNYMSGARTGRGDIYITWFVGMFMKGMLGDDVQAYITDLDLEPGGAYTADTSSALRTVVLVR